MRVPTAIAFERLALYEEVWTTPLSKLGPKYGLSDNGLRKICKALNIPLPIAGHWARLAAGQTVKRTPLPSTAPRTTFVSNPPAAQQVGDAVPEDAEWLGARLKEEKLPSHEVRVDSEPEHWHKAIRPLRASLIAAEKEYWKLVRERDASVARRAKMKNPGPNFDHFKYQNLDSGLLFSDRVKSALRVSTLTYHRALAIANALFFAAESRGCTVGVNEEAGRLTVELEKTKFLISIRERQTFDVVPVSATYASLGTERKFKPTNRLALVISRWPVGEFEIADSEKALLEERLGSIFPRLYRTVIAARERGREREAQQVSEAANRAEAELLALRKEEERRGAEKAESLRVELLNEATDWQLAQQLRDYVKAVLLPTTSKLSVEATRWRAWALDVAEKVDPLERRRARLRGDSQEDQAENPG